MGSWGDLVISKINSLSDGLQRINKGLSVVAERRLSSSCLAVDQLDRLALPKTEGWEERGCALTTPKGVGMARSTVQLKGDFS